MPKGEKHTHNIEILWDDGNYQSVRCKTCDYEELIYYGD